MDTSFQKLYHDFYLRLVRQAAFILGDITAAEDLTQEAFIRLHRTGLTNVENPSGWLARVTNNLCFDYLRSEGSRRRREEKYAQPGHTNISFAESAENLLVDKEEVRLVHQVIEELQPRDRLVLLMKFSGYSYDEIAAVTDLNKSSVGTTLARARERFKRVYQEMSLRGVTR